MKIPEWIQDHIQFIPDFLTLAECEHWKKVGMEQEQLPGTGPLWNNETKTRFFNPVVRAVKVRFFHEGPAFDMMKGLVEKVNADPAWGYVLTEMDDVQFARYERNDFFEWHSDLRRERGETVRKVSAVVQLDNRIAYEGGHLQFQGEDGIPWEPSVFMNQGCAVVFTSSFVHRVTPVKSGARHSMTAWFKGPPLR